MIEYHIDSLGKDAKYWDEHYKELLVLIDEYYFKCAKHIVDYYETEGIDCTDYNTESKRLKELDEFLEDCWD